MTPQKDETSIDFLRRVVHNLGYEDESLLMSLPSVQSIIDFAALWDVYDTDYMQGIEEAIHCGDSPQPLKDFVAKYKLDWDLAWVERIECTA